MAEARIRPSLFVGSSAEGLPIAKAIQVCLDHACEVALWTQGIFGLTQGTLESLVLALDSFDFAVLVLTADDLTTSRGVEKPAARDNVLFELGLFVGGLGRDRTFMLYDRSSPPALPSDRAGVTAATFMPHVSGNLENAVGAACTQIERVITKKGVRESQKVKRLAEATESVEGVGSRVQELVRVLARSRKVELDIIIAQFGQVIEPEKLAQVRQDLRELEALLRNDE
jgi:Predicted nucleotide-binding protein containing TIR-like domain